MVMRKLLINSAVIASLALSGCSYTDKRPDDFIPPVSKLPGIYRIPIQQGNLITQEMINELKPGMTKQQVRYLLGTPLLIDTFNEDRWTYLYTNRPASRRANTETEKQRLELQFENGRLVNLVGDMYPQGKELARYTKEQNRERTVVIPADEPKPQAHVGILERVVNTATGRGKPVTEKVDLPEKEPEPAPAEEQQ